MTTEQKKLLELENEKCKIEGELIKHRADSALRYVELAVGHDPFGDDGDAPKEVGTGISDETTAAANEFLRLYFKGLNNEALC